MARIVITGKFVSEPKRVIDPFGHKFVEVEIEESRKQITKNYSLFKVFFNSKLGKRIIASEPIFDNYTFTVIGNCLNVNGEKAFIYAEEVYATRDKNGEENVIKPES